MGVVQDYYNTKGSYSLGLHEENVHQKILKNIGTGQKILDVGCSSGYLGRLMKEKGNIVYGVEISEGPAKEAKGLLDDVFIGNIEEVELPWPEESFDVIVCADVLEHLFDPGLALIKLKKLMNENGKLIISLPNVAYYGVRKNLLFGRFEYQETGVLEKGHLRFFTRSSAAGLLKKAGFEVISIEPSIYLPRFYKAITSLPVIRYLFNKYFSGIFASQYVFLSVHKENGN